MTTYSLEDLAEAKAELQIQNARWENYSGNNPNKFYTQIEEAKLKVYLIETELKQSGLIQLSPNEARDALLDEAFPNAKSKEIVDWQGKKYKKCFSPVSKSRSGKTVYGWRKYWREVTNE